MDTYEDILLKINSLEEFHRISSNLPPSPYKNESSDDQRKGDFFELFTKLYLKVKFPEEYSDVWLLSEIPSKDLKKLNMKRKDRGIDLLAKKRFGEKYVSIQAKYRSNQQRLVLRDIDSFSSYSFASDVKNEYIETGLVVTTSDRPINDKERPKLKFQERGDLQNFNDWYKIHALIKKEKLPPKEIITPYLFQQEIIDELVNYYSSGGDKAKMILPCGTGKTFISYWIMKALKPQKILVAAPSIALVKQILDEWNERFIADNKFPSILVICSDDTVQKDSYVSSVSEIVHRTTTDKEDIKEFLNRDNELQLIISTYQSGEKLIEASKETNTVFDFAIYDEAHRTVGRNYKKFSALVPDENIKTHQKLFMTATERVFAGKSKEQIISMDDSEFYGSKTVSRSYNEIVELDESPIIDYKILTIGISKQEILDHWKNNSIVKYDKKNEEELRNLSVGILQKKLYEEFGVRLSISFHNSLKRAKDLTNIIENLKNLKDYPQLETFFIEGSQNSSDKKNTLNDFSKSQNAIITNAKCLTEGVDIRAVDAVIFSDPKKSVIDIVQASGRALRKSRTFEPRKNMVEQKGIIVVPLIIDYDQDLDDIKESEPFKKVIDVIKALATQDERIVAYFKERNRSDKRGLGGGEEGIFESINISSNELEESIHFEVWDKIAKLNWRPFEEAREFVISLGLKSTIEYKEWTKTDERPKDIPTSPNIIYKNKGWAGFDDFLGTGNFGRNRELRPFEEAREFVISLGLKSYTEWREWTKTDEKPTDIPTSPDVVYKNKGWDGWGDFLGTGNKGPEIRDWRPFEEAREFVISLGFKGLTEWREWTKTDERPKDIPAYPEQSYKNKGWDGWGDFLGTGYVHPTNREFRPFEEAREFAISLGFKLQTEWREWTKTDERPKDIPAYPEQVYKNKGWAGMGDFLGSGNLGRNRDWRPFEEAREFVISLGLKSTIEYKEWSKTDEIPKDIPANPDRVYKNKGWAGMGDFLGTGNKRPEIRDWRPFEEAREFVISLGFKRVTEYTEWCKTDEKPKDIPANPFSVYKNKGWAGMGDFLGTGNLGRNRDWRPFEEAREFVISLGFKGLTEWREWTKTDERPKDIPANPDRVYKNKGWIDWFDWLGKS